MTVLAASSVVFPSLSVTVRAPGPVSLPVPMCTTTLFFFIRCVTPWLSCLATPRERLTTAARSAEIPSAFSP